MRYEFRFNRRKLMYRRFLLAFALSLPVIIADEIMSNLQLHETLFAIIFLPLWFGFGIAFVCLVFSAFFLTNANGFGVLHDDHVEINLNGNEYLIKYDDINKIQDKIGLPFSLSQSWVIKYNGSRVLKIHQGEGFKKKNLYPVENFFLALKKRVKREVYL